MGLLRFIYAIAVVLIHTTPILGFTLLSRDLAVWSFFIISGFYMGLILNEKYIGKNNSTLLFLTNRFLRIFPIYFVSLILTITVFIVMEFLRISNPLHEYLINQTNNIGRVWDFLRNSTLLIAPEYFYEPKKYPGFLFLPQAWTLQLELLFYLFAPLIFRRKWIILVCVLLVILFFDYKFIFPLNLFSGQSLLYRFFTNIPFFLMGGISYKIYSYVSNRKIKKRYLLGIYIFFVILTLTYNYIHLVIPYVTYRHHTDWQYYLILMVSIPFFFILTKNSSMDRLIGELSYPVYITHTLIITVLVSFFPQVEKSFSYPFVVIIFTCALSVPLAFILDRKIDSLRQKRLSLSSKKREQFSGLFPKNG